MASPNLGGNVYKREGDDLHEAWNAVIRKINGDRENPPEDTSCEELDPIDEVEAEHIWTKEDVEDIREAIDEMCEFAWVEDLDFWHDRIIVEIDEALDRELGGWGDEEECCEGCLDDCANAISGDGLVETYIGSYTVTACREFGDDCGGTCSSDDQQAAATAGLSAQSQITDWKNFWRAYCMLVKEVKVLEKELEILEIQLTALEEARDEECAQPEPNNCEERQQEVDEKQQEVDEKQEELDAKEIERDEKLAEADAAEASAESYAALSMSLISPGACLQLYFPDLAGNEPWPVETCEELGPECLGMDPYRCKTTWAVYRKIHVYSCYGSEFHGYWVNAMGGAYTMSGSPFITGPGRGRAIGCGVSNWACISTNCEGWSSCGTGCSNYTVIEVKMIQSFPSTTSEGETCCP